MILRPVKLKKRVTYLTLSDIHTLNNLNETGYIVDSLYHYFDGFSSKSRFTDLDIIFLAGDIFDYFEDSRSPSVVLVLNWMSSLMSFCVKHKIKLRVLEGTPGHDFKQAKMFQSIADGYGPGLDYKYFDVLDIEIMDDLGVSILYVPDEWKQSAAKAKEDVIAKMQEYGLQTITMACMHGMFDFQIPELPVEHPLKHESAWYLDIIETFINIGHDHKAKFFMRILVQGSFDRIAHGEEEKKGGIVCTLDPVLGNSYEFVENKRARIFKTITVKTKELDKAIEQVKDALKGVPNNSHIRISTGPDNPILSVMDELKRSFPDMIFKKHKDKKQIDNKTNRLAETVNLTESFVSLSMDKDNIVDMILSAMDLEDIDKSDIELLTQELKGIT